MKYKIQLRPWRHLCLLLLPLSPVLSNVKADEQYHGYALHASNAPVIDGNLEELWKDALSIKFEEMAAGPPYYIQAKIYLMWDNANIYLGAKIWDNEHHGSRSSADIWQNDCIQVAFSDEHGQNHFEYGISLTEKGTDTYCWLHPQNNSNTNIKGVVSREGNITTYEVVCPKESLSPLIWGEGSTIRFSLAVIDRSERDSCQEWGGGIVNTPVKDPNLFGYLHLVNKPEAMKLYSNSKGDLVKNGSFEVGEKMPEEWRYSGALVGARGGFSSEALSGTKSVFMELSEPKASATWNSEVLSLKGATRYRFSLWTKSEIGGYCCAYLYEQDEKGNSVQPKPHEIWLGGSQDWNKCIYNFISNPQTKKLIISIRAWGSNKKGKRLFDHVVLLPAEEEKEKSLLLLSDNLPSRFCQSVGVLYPGLVDSKLVYAPEAKEKLNKFKKIIISVTKKENISQIPYNELKKQAADGADILMGLDEYAHFNKLVTNFTVMPYKKMNDLVAEIDQPVPNIEILIENDVTTGFPKGSIIPWYGLEGDDLTYERTFREGDKYLQRQIMGLKETEGKNILARSTVNEGAVFIQEQVGKGRIIAMDILSPCEPMWQNAGAPPWPKDQQNGGWKERGGFYKYFFLGNVCGKSMRSCGRYFNRRPDYKEFIQWQKELCDKHDILTLKRETSTHVSITIGDDHKPIYAFRSDVHSPGEWASAFGLLQLGEYIAKNANKDEFLSRRLENYCVKILPIGFTGGPECWNCRSKLHPDWLGVAGDCLAKEGGQAPLSPETIQYINSLGEIADTSYYKIYCVPGWHGSGGFTHGLFGAIQDTGRNLACVQLAAKTIEDGLRDRFVVWMEGKRLGQITDYVDYVGREPFVGALEHPIMYMSYFFPDVESIEKRRMQYSVCVENFAAIYPPLPACDATAEEHKQGKCQCKFFQYYKRTPYFLALGSEIDVETALGFFLPHAWHCTSYGKDIESFRWTARDKTGPVVMAYPHKQEPDPKSIRPHWDRCEIIEAGNTNALEGEFYYSPLSGLKHARWASFGFIQALGNFTWCPDWGEESNPTFATWHYLDDSDVLRPCLKRHLAYFDSDKDSYLDTYLLDKDNDGFYDKEVRYHKAKKIITLSEGAKSLVKEISLDFASQTKGDESVLDKSISDIKPPYVFFSEVRPVAAIDIYHGNGDRHSNFADLFQSGYSSLGTYLVRKGYTLKHIAEPLSDKSLSGVRALIITRVGGKSYTDLEIDAIHKFVHAGGILIVSIDEASQVSFPEYYRITLPFGIMPAPEVISSYRKVTQDRFDPEEWVSMIQFIDNSGVELLKDIDKLMVNAYSLGLVSPAKPLISFLDKPIVAYRAYGKGKVFVSGASDLLNNETISDRLNFPLELRTENYPSPAGNRIVKNRIIDWLLGDGGFRIEDISIGKDKGYCAFRGMAGKITFVLPGSKQISADIQGDGIHKMNYSGEKAEDDFNPFDQREEKGSLLTSKAMVAMLSSVIDLEFPRQAERMRGARFLCFGGIAHEQYLAHGIWTSKREYAPGEEITVLYSHASKVKTKGAVELVIYKDGAEKIAEAHPLTPIPKWEGGLSEFRKELEFGKRKFNSFAIKWSPNLAPGKYRVSIFVYDADGKRINIRGRWDRGIMPKFALFEVKDSHALLLQKVQAIAEEVRKMKPNIIGGQEYGTILDYLARKWQADKISDLFEEGKFEETESSIEEYKRSGK